MKKTRSKFRFIALVPLFLLTSPANVQTKELPEKIQKVDLVEGMNELNSVVDNLRSIRYEE